MNMETEPHEGEVRGGIAAHLLLALCRLELATGTRSVGLWAVRRVPAQRL